jgi:L-lactate utilization protein LutC
VAKMTDDVLGTVAKKVKGENVQRAVEQGSEFFEESQYAEPARQIRDDMKAKIDDVVTSAKELPARELKTVQREVCKQWLGDEIIIATPSAQP